ncbi:MAG TPA: CrcB family protein [Acidimicrobiia bacterium]|nr:CrcB family protein [Acidimicrobiia bacterium]
MQALVAVTIGGGVGSALRYLVSAPLNDRLPASGTAVVNVVGSLALGLLVGWYSTRDGGGTARLALGTGLLGGFTTFSAWMAESIDAFDRPGRMALTILLPVAAGLLAAWLGVLAGRSL